MIIKVFLSFIVFILVYVLSYSIYFYWFPGIYLNGHLIVENRKDDVYIQKDGKKIIEHSIVDYIHHENFIVGLRSPSFYMVCDGGSAYAIIQSMEKLFFILNYKNGEIFETNDISVFKVNLSEKDIIYDIDKSLEKFNKYKRRYSNSRKYNVLECELVEDWR